MTRRLRPTTRILMAGLVLSTMYVAYAMTPYSHLWRVVSWRDASGHLHDYGLRLLDWPFVPMLSAHSLGLELVYGRSHPGPTRFLIMGWLASLPMSVLCAYGLRAVGRPAKVGRSPF